MTTGAAAMKRYRKLRGLSQEDLARLANVKLPTVQAAEQGKNHPKFQTAKAYDEALKADGAVLAAFGFRTPEPTEVFVPSSLGAVGFAQLAELAEQVRQVWAELRGYQQSHVESRQRGEAWMADVSARLEKLEAKAERPARRSKPTSG